MTALFCGRPRFIYSVGVWESMQPQLGRDLAMQAVLMAVWQRRSPEVVLLHSDQGTQYTAQAFSMTGVENCYVNAVAENVFGLLKCERVH